MWYTTRVDCESGCGDISTQVEVVVPSSATDCCAGSSPFARSVSLSLCADLRMTLEKELREFCLRERKVQWVQCCCFSAGSRVIEGKSEMVDKTVSHSVSCCFFPQQQLDSHSLSLRESWITHTTLTAIQHYSSTCKFLCRQLERQLERRKGWWWRWRGWRRRRRPDKAAAIWMREREEFRKSTKQTTHTCHRRSNSTPTTNEHTNERTFNLLSHCYCFQIYEYSGESVKVIRGADKINLF